MQLRFCRQVHASQAGFLQTKSSLNNPAITPPLRTLSLSYNQRRQGLSWNCFLSLVSVCRQQAFLLVLKICVTIWVHQLVTDLAYLHHTSLKLGNLGSSPCFWSPLPLLVTACLDDTHIKSLQQKLLCTAPGGMMQPTWRSSTNPGFLTHCIERVTAGEKEEIKQAQWLIGKDKKNTITLKRLISCLGTEFWQLN